MSSCRYLFEVFKNHLRKSETGRVIIKKELYGECKIKSNNNKKSKRLPKMEK